MKKLILLLSSLCLTTSLFAQTMQNNTVSGPNNTTMTPGNIVTPNAPTLPNTNPPEAMPTPKNTNLTQPNPNDVNSNITTPTIPSSSTTTPNTTSPSPTSPITNTTGTTTTNSYSY